MLSIQPITSAADAAKYYTSTVNYYLSDGGSEESPGQWYGKGAELLGLSGNVSPEVFLQLLQGKLPSGQQLGIVDKNGEIQHRPATDLTLSAPKSFSNLALVGGDERLIDVHNAGVREVMKAVEKLAAEARITINRETGFEKTGNLVMSLFQHTTSREFDAALHDHCLIMNMTQRSDGEWRSLSSKAREDKSHPENGFREIIYQNQHYLGLIYNSSIAKGTCDVGYDIEVKDQYGNFEIKGIPDAYIKRTSKRRNQIKNSLFEKGFSSAKAAEKANLDTRRSKEAIDNESLLLYWKDEATQFGVDFKALIEDSKQREKGCISTREEVKVSETAKDAISDALEQLSNFSTQIKHGDLVRMAFTFARGTIHHEELEKEITTRFTDKRLEGVQSTYYTTKALINQEKSFIKQFKGALGTGMSRETGQSGIGSEMLRANDRVQLIDVRGFTHEKALIEELVHTTEANGFGAYVLHVGRLQRNRLNDSISRDSSNVWKWVTNLFKGELVQTVAGFTASYEEGLHSSSKKQDVVIVHDAQKLSYKDLMSLESLTAQSQSKLILLNNTRSTEGFSAGSPIKALKDAGFKSLQATTEEKKVDFLLTESKNINQALAIAFVNLDADSHLSTQVVALTNKNVEALTTLIRAGLKAKGEISLQSKEVNVLSTQLLSDVQKQNPKFFEKGDQVTFNAFTREQHHYRITGKEGELISLADKDGREKWLSLSDNETFMVTKNKAIELSIGDALVTEKSIYLGQGYKIERGENFSVQEIRNEGVMLTHNKKQLYFSNEELHDLSISHNYVRKPNQLTKNALTVMTALEGYQINKNVLGELSEFAQQIHLFTNDKERATTQLNQEKLSFTIRDVATGAPSLVYRDSQYADSVICKDLEYLSKALSKDQKETCPKTIATTAVAYATAKLASREAAFPHKILLREAMIFAMGEVNLADIEHAIESKAALGDLIHAKTFWISKESLAIENGIIKNNLEGQGKVEPISTSARLLSLPKSLTQGQKDAATLALTTCDRFTSVQGLAGTGKTTMMREIQAIAKAEGHMVVGLAPMHSSKDELISSGIESITIARFLTQDKVYPDNTLFIIDESSMIGNQNYLGIQTKIKELNARGFFGGDITQLQSASSGTPHELTVKTETQKTAYMNEIMRQNKNPTLKKAVIHASNQEIKESFATIKTINPERHVERVVDTPPYPASSVITINCRNDRTKEMDYAPIYHAIASDYLTRIPEHQKNTLVIAHAHEDRNAINSIIRQGLQTKGRLGLDEVKAERLAARSFSSAELHSISNYERGDVLRFDANYSVAKKGEYFTVERVDKENQRLHCQSEDGITFSINPAAIAGKSRMSVYRREEALLAKGDTIRLRLTDTARGREANKAYTVASVTEEVALLHNDEGSLELKLNQKIDAHWDYSYTTTAFGAEGLTSEFVLALELAKRTKATTHRSHEISVTRPREQVTIYTEDEGALVERLVKLEGDKTSAYQMAMKDAPKASSSKTSQERLINKEKASHTARNYKEPTLTAAEINQALLPQMESLCERLLGKASSSHGGSIRYGSKGSLSINLKSGLWFNFETGEKGNALQLIAAEMGFSEFKESIAYAKDFLNIREGMGALPKVSQKLQNKSVASACPNKKEYAKKLYEQSIPVEGTLAEKYLKEHRKLTNFKSADIRFVPKISTWHGNKKTEVSALLCITRDGSGSLNNVQVIRLNPLTGEKDNASKIKKQTYGAINGCPVNLNTESVQKTTYLTEGTETGFSLLSASKDARVMTVLGKENFNNIDLSRLTDNVVMCVDNDGENTFGDMKVITAAFRIMSAGKSVSIICPENKGEDFNDVLVKEGVSRLKDYMKNEINVKSAISSLNLSCDGSTKTSGHEDHIHAQNRLLKSAVMDKKTNAHVAKIIDYQSINTDKKLDYINKTIPDIRQKQQTDNNKILEMER